MSTATEVVSPEAVVLGLLSTFRATPLAVVYALLSAPQPRRLLTAYITAGLLVSLAAGTVVVSLFGASTRAPESTTARAIVDLVVGIGALSYTAGFFSGRIGERAGGSPSPWRSRAEGALGRRLRRPATSTAATLGAVTNLPGLFYLAGLVAILDTNPGPVNGIVQLGIYNVLRFAVPIAALVLVRTRPAATRSIMDTTRDWARRHSRQLVLVVFGTVGVYLTGKGLVGLLS